MDFFTSDTHFGHSNIIGYCNRPFTSVEQMNQEMVERWNRVVMPEDTVYHLGDMAMGPKAKWQYYRWALRGRIVYILGNHDVQYREKFEQLLVMPQDVVLESYRYYSDQYGMIDLAHIPVEGDARRGYERAGMDRSSPADYHLCGHVHDAWVRHGQCINVGVDVWDFTPQPLDVIIAGSEDNEKRVFEIRQKFVQKPLTRLHTAGILSSVESSSTKIQPLDSEETK